MNDYSRNVNEILEHIDCRKDNLVRFIKRNFKIKEHFVEVPTNVRRHGGNNQKDILMTQENYDLVLKSFNLKNRYVPIFQNLNQVNIIMSLENQTIGFIGKIFEGATNLKRQYSIGTYKVDICFIDYKIVVECNENNHDDRDPTYEKTREKYISDNGYKLIIFDPNNECFKLHEVINVINKIILKLDYNGIVRLPLLSNT